jgi:hypothetical protein
MLLFVDDVPIIRKGLDSRKHCFVLQSLFEENYFHLSKNNKTWSHTLENTPLDNE